MIKILFEYKCAWEIHAYTPVFHNCPHHSVFSRQNQTLPSTLIHFIFHTKLSLSYSWECPVSYLILRESCSPLHPPPQSALVKYDLPTLPWVPRARGTSSHLPVSLLVVSNLPACTGVQAPQGQGLFWQSVLLLGSSTWTFLSEDFLNCIR